MAYIGNIPAEKYSSFVKQDFTTSATTTYTLDQPVTNENEIALFINFVRQEPTTAYTASGVNLTLSSATSASDDMYCIFLGKALQTVNPPNSSVGSSQVSSDLITGQTALGATPADTDELLISDDGTLKRVDYSYLKSANTPYFEASRTSNQTITHDTFTKVAVDSEVLDTDNNYDPTTNYRFTPTTAGKYYIYGQATAQSSSTGQLKRYSLIIRKNGSNYKFMSNYFTGNEAYLSTIYIGSIIDFNGSSDYVELWCKLEYASSGTLQLNSSSGKTELTFGGYKIIE